LDCLNCHSATDAHTCRPAHLGREQLTCGSAVIASSNVGLIGLDGSAGAPQKGQSNKEVEGIAIPPLRSVMSLPHPLPTPSRPQPRSCSPLRPIDAVAVRLIYGLRETTTCLRTTDSTARRHLHDTRNLRRLSRRLRSGHRSVARYAERGEQGVRVYNSFRFASHVPKMAACPSF
jgi:hypothetical protein